MANNLAQRRIAPQIRPSSTETPVVDMATLAKQIANIERMQKSMLAVQNDQDARIEHLQLNVNSITALTYPTQVYIPMQLINTAPATAFEYSIQPDVRRIGASIRTETTIFEEPSTEIPAPAEVRGATQAADGVPIEKILMLGGSVSFLLSLSSCIVWLTGDIALIHPAASVIGLLVSPCVYMMGLAARKHIAS